MESSEDDAGTATSASRCASAREKDVGQAEDVDATRNFQHESSEARASCGTPAMSEDNFDNDSVPSPSTKDTSTEAILDMIDDFIDGPGASKRLPLESQAVVDPTCNQDTKPTVQAASASLDSQHNIESEMPKELFALPPREPSPTANANRESLSESARVQPAEAECTPHSEILICANTSTSEEQPQGCSSIQVIINENPSQQSDLSKNDEPEVLTEQPVIALPLSSVETLQAFSDTSECENQERTVKCVTSSENRDSVTVELAESTSSECSVSESKSPTVEPSVPRSPLKRRLIRPAPSDRRPDSTVSSTADSQSTDINTTDQTSNEIITKDVSSSSDAVLNVHGSTKPEEISNVSEISICKAETSTAPSRKIKLVRPKVTPVMSHSIRIESQMSIARLEKDQCQSTSSDDISTLSSAEPSVETSSIVTTAKSEQHESKLVPVIAGITSVNVQSAETSEKAVDATLKSQDVSNNTTAAEKPQNIEIPKLPELFNQKKDEPSPTLNTVSASVEPSPVTENLSDKIHSEKVQQSSDSKKDGNIVDEEKKVPPIKLCLLVTKPSESEIKTHDLKSQCSNTNVGNSENSSKDDNKLLSSMDPILLSEDISTEKLQKQSSDIKKDGNIVDQEKKVPPIKLSLLVTKPSESEIKTHGLKSQYSNTNVGNSETVSKDDNNKPLSSMVPILHPEDISTEKVQKQSSDSKKDGNIVDDEKKVPPIKLSLLVAKSSELEIKTQDLKSQCSNTNVENSENSSKDDNKPSSSMVPILLEDTSKNYDQDSKQVENIENISKCNILKSIDKKVPPIKLSLTNAEQNKHSELPSSIQKSKIVEHELTSQKIEDPTKQVPKLTIKLTNKHTEEAKSPVPKLTIKPLRPPAQQNIGDLDTNQQIPSVSKINIKPIVKPTEKGIESVSKSLPLHVEQNKDGHDTVQQITSVTKINIKPIVKHTENVLCLLPPVEQNKDGHDTNQQIPSITKIIIKPIVKPTENVTKCSLPPVEQNKDGHDTNQQIPSVTKINIKPIVKPTEKTSGSITNPLKPPVGQNADDCDTNQQTPSVTKINIKPIVKPAEKGSESIMKPSQPHAEQVADDCDTNQQIPSVSKINIKPIPKPTDKGNESVSKSLRSSAEQINDEPDPRQQIPSVTKINIKPIPKPGEKGSESISKISQPSAGQNTDSLHTNKHIPSVTKINIKPIPKPTGKVNDTKQRLHTETHQNDLTSRNEIPNITKLNIKPILKPPEKINEIHRKSSSSEISESEYSENDESTSTSDQASASDQGPLDTVPKVTIKLGKPGTESEGKFYTEKNVPKLTKKNMQHGDKDDKDSKLKLIISSSDDKQHEKIPKITIKSVTRSDSQPLSPKLTIKPLKPPENVNKDSEIPKLKISPESFSSSAEVKENLHIPKITIKPVTKTDADGTAKTPKKSTVMCDSSEHIPVVTKLNIKPILKPTESGESYDEKVPVVSKLNIKPVIKPKDSEVDSSIEDVPKFIKLNIKPLKNPEESSSEEKDCDEMNADKKDSSIPIVTKLNIKPIVKPVEDEALKDSENQSSETSNSSDDNAEHIPTVTKLNIKPIVKPNELEEPTKSVHNEQSIPVVTKINIKPIIKPDDHVSPSSPKKESLKSPGSSGIPVVTKLNIKPILKPEESLNKKEQEENIDKSSKNPSLVMKINRKNVSECISENEHLYNNIAGKAHSPKMLNSPKATKRSATVESTAELNIKPTSSRNIESVKNIDCNPGSPSLLHTDTSLHLESSCEANIVPENVHKTILNELHSSSKSVNPDENATENYVQESVTKSEPISSVDKKASKKNVVLINEVNEINRIAEHYNTKSSIQNCTLLKKLLSSKKEDLDKTQETKASNCFSHLEKTESTISNCLDARVNEEGESKLQSRFSPKLEKAIDLRYSSESSKMRSIQEIQREANESVTKPLEVSITDKITNQSSDQDSPRIILKINKTDHGASSKIITEEIQKPDCSPSKDGHESEHVVETVNDIPSPKKHLVNSRRKATATDSPVNLTMGKRLRSSRIVEPAEKTPVVKRSVNKRPSATETTSPPQQKESEISILEAKRIKLEQLLSANKSLTITPVASKTTPSKSSIAFNQGAKVSHNHSLLNNENCSQKNGNSKLHNILSNLQAKQMQSLQLNDTNVSDKPTEIVTEVESSTSTGSSDVVVEIKRVENCHPEVQEMLINENSVCDLTEPDEVSQDPLEVECVKTPTEEVKETASITTIEVTPTPRKRGRPRKLPLPGSATPAPPAPPQLPVPALEERPQRSLRLMRDRPAILKKPRGGRGRGRGGRRAAILPPKPEPEPEPVPEPEPEPVVVVEVVEARPPSPIDPTSSRIKLPRMTEALDKSVAGSSCATPLSSRRRSSAVSSDLKLFGSAAVVLESPVKAEEFMKSPEAARPRSGRGSRGGRGRTPRNRGRGRGGGRGAMYMKETMGIYGRVCGPATTTVQLFEEETCMMDDNATPSKPSHLLDEDSQSSVKSSTNDSNKMKKSKFADLFDSNKVWTAADVKEYTWPSPDTPNSEPQVMMIQEQVAMFLGVKSFKRRYPELKRRTVGGAEREYVLSKGVVSEALCDLGITAVDASEVLDIMLSDYPHKYEEYRSHQRERQIASSSEETVDSKLEEKPVKVEVKAEKSSEKPEPPKVDPEKTRQDMAAAAIASATEWNARCNAWRRPACVDLQSMTVHRRRAPPAPPPLRVRPPAGFYPHALLPGQFQHLYRTYTADQLRYFPLNTVLAAPPAPPSPTESSSESEASWGGHSSSDDSDAPHHHSAKRKKLSRVKRSSHQDKEDSRGPEPEVDLCRVCNLRLEANRKYTHERFLVCAHCNAKLHPGCVELPADTIRKCREYPWQCAECKSCCACRRPQDDDKMLFCDLCDRGFHIYCVGLAAVPSGRWHCVECAICKSCGARDPNGLTPGAPGTAGEPGTPGSSMPGPSTPGLSSGPGEWHHQTRRGPGGHKVYSHSLCTPCARVR